ncbi:MAG TPA: Rho termination factor N-terminal domain-containing protein [Nitrospirota bacterium]|nr:Rho termination factor N-terminal domain-containing protein [Nitrospirota bacterium]
MKVPDIKDIAKRNGVNAGKMNKQDLIRAIQRAEGSNACFATSSGQACGQMNCLWRADCK